MTHAKRFEAALRSRDPARSLHAAVLELAANGCQKPDIYGFLEEFLLDLRTRDDYRESDEDAVLDVMDALTGWCHPDARLLPEQNSRVVRLADDVASAFPDEAAVNELLERMPYPRYPLRKGRIAFQFVLEPIVFRGEPQQHPRGLAMLGDHDLLLAGCQW